ncbi:DUF2931 family protein [Tatumella sp. UCD-D_suzukii]|uniref:DUF2931 family protein n=1 Tax=Tatumella sp. UCD-D_suzukii TaxID=1408192 RepID=UPI0004714F53|nr:DUF2931 family protein [Tatumella sp. UCD-D_suzukii]
MKLNPLIPLLMTVMVSGCHTGEPQTPEETGEMPYGKVGFAFFTPRALPAVVTRALIIDNEQVVSTFRTLDSTPGDPDTTKIWNNRVRMNAQFNQIRHPPAQMMFCWDSIIDKKTYETSIIFSPSLREAMSVPTGKDLSGNTAWYKTLLFGLAPEGKVRIWLQNSSGKVRNLPVEPLTLTTVSGDQLYGCKGITQSNFSYGYDQDIKDFIKGKTYPYGNW